MMRVLLLLLVVSVALVSAQDVPDSGDDLVFVQTVDDFIDPTTVIVIVIPATGVPTGGISVTQTTDASGGILGDERNLEMRVESGVPSAVFSTGVNNDEWSVSSPQDARGFALMQYDGVDGSIALNTAGLANTDLTVGGLATGFRFEIESDLDTIYSFFYYCAAGESSTSVDIPGSDNVKDLYFIPFDSFEGPCSPTDVGAVEILIEAFDNVDTIITEFSLVGPPVANSPSPPPVAPPPPGGFTWYTFDDDDNGRSPCGDELPRKSYFLSDRNVFYYYVFPGFSFEGESSSSSSSSSGAATVVPTTIFAAVIALLYLLF